VELLQRFALRGSDVPGVSGLILESFAQSNLARTVDHGLSLGVWAQEQLAQIPELLAPLDSLRTWSHALEWEIGRYERFSERPEEVRAFFEQGGPPEGEFRRTLRHLSAYVMGDTYFQDNLAIIRADYEYALAGIDAKSGLPALAQREGVAPTQRIRDDRSILTDVYYTPLKDLMGWGRGHADQDGFGIDVSSPIRWQTATDHGRLAAALELERRTTGQFPESLNAVNGFFPSGIPHDVASGQSYFYQRTEDGGYRLWGTSIDQQNDQGDPKRDLVFESPKR
jgi:hypothetical protein